MIMLILSMIVWVITEIDNHQIIWINLKYEFNNHRPSVDEEDESENSDS